VIRNKVRAAWGRGNRIMKPSRHVYLTVGDGKEPLIKPHVNRVSTKRHWMLDAQRRTVFDMAAESAAAAVRGNADDAFSLKPVGTALSGGIALLLVACLDQPNGDSSRLALPPGKRRRDHAVLNQRFL